jgi:catechol 2,3-dioxygenase-like lactoylglutathione lyase family enzyme
MLLACSHVVLASDDVPRITRFFSRAFGITPAFENDLFAEFVLPSKFRIAFFRPVGASARTFRTSAERSASALGVTVASVDESYLRLAEHPELAEFAIQLSGPPKEHPWGEKSFLLTDPDGNRWEIAQSPSSTGMLDDR